MRRKVVGGALVAAAVVLAPGVAWADECVNFSRGAGRATAWETTRGRWTFIAPDLGEFWVFDSPDGFQNGRTGALLDGSEACRAERLQGHTQGVLEVDRLKGIWSEQCVMSALGS